MTPKRSVLLLAALALACGIGVGIGKIQNARDAKTILVTTGADTLDPLAAGQPDAAMQQARTLYQQYKASGWRVRRLHLAALKLPDQQYAEDEDVRAGNVSAWVFPKPDGVYDKVAFYTPLYARMRRSFYKDGTTTAKPEGYYIIAWKDGRVERVPVSQLRDVSTPVGSVTLWPGMPGYEKGRLASAYQ